MPKDQISIEIPGLEELAKGLAILGEFQEVKDAIRVAAEGIEDALADYPPRKYVSIQEAGGWVSEKQRRYVIAAIRDGRIEFPYRRGQSDPSEDLGQSWTIKEEAQGFGARIGNDTSYGPYVQDAKEQSAMMAKIGWKTTEEVAEEEEDNVVNDVLGAIDRALDRIE